MAALHKVIVLILPLLFLAAVDATHHKHRRRHHHDDDDSDDDDPNPFDRPDLPDPFDLLKPKDSLPDGNPIGNPFGVPLNPFGPDNPINIPSNPFGPDNPINRPNNPIFDGKDLNLDVPAKPDFETVSLGMWELLNVNTGVSAMHVQLMANNRIILYDTIIYRISRIKALPGDCIQFLDPQNVTQQDCWAHVVEYDIETNQVVRPIKIETDPWCSSGGVAPDGSLVSTGGFMTGTRSLRFLSDCDNCPWRDYPNTFKEDRWYATQAKLADGGFILVGGRRAFSYEYIPLEGEKSDKLHFFPFLYETSDLEENNLYPFVHLSVDGNVFVFSNNRSLLLNPKTNKIVRTFPVLPGGSRNYPASGMSALLPIKLDADGKAESAEVMVCGGNTPDAFHIAETLKQYLPALQDCNRMVITDREPAWDSEMMPSRRTMGDLLNLPNGQLLFINGAENGTSAWWDADVPNLTPVLYSPDKPKGERFKVMAGTSIARMYHSTSAVLPNGKIWVSGSNTHNTYRDVDKFPTETRVENFSPPYLDPALDGFRPVIVDASSTKLLNYKKTFETGFTVTDGTATFTKNDIKVVMYAPPFTTHGFSMNQRQVVLPPETLTVGAGGVYTITSMAPASGEVAPPGYYLLFVVHRGVPSKGLWVQIGV
ncbi:aldehyde oxidase GLOX1-like [Prosopis cineraria]|uniref:aldehyde oxidase GLOX1-like n=1 Tax=Prosopis cineraria TaxID=364024 RepID=UPI00240EF18A|nr:aldehyde oxidase GLOX1-like [Prosopis cineraria]